MTGPQRILVTGAGGYIGSAATARLAEHGHEVIALVRKGTARLMNNPALSCVRYVEAPPAHSLEGGQALAKEVEGADIALHLAWASQVRGLSESTNLDRALCDIEFSRQVCDLCQVAGIGHFIFASSAGAVYDGPMPESGFDETCATMSDDIYGRTKLTVEQDLLERFGKLGKPDRCAHILRITTPFGPGNRRNRHTGVINNFVEAALAGRPLEVFGAGAARRDFVYIEDLVEMIARLASALPDKSSIWNIGTSQTATVNEVAGIIEEVLGRELPRKRVNVDAGSSDIRIDTSKFRQAHRFSPRYSIRSGIEALIESTTKYSEA